MEKVAAFCNRIAPGTWNIAGDPDEFLFKGPRMLNILLVRLNHFIDGWCYAFKKGRMETAPVSHYAETHEGARRAFELYGDHIVSRSEIWLYPEGCAFYGDDVFAVAVHEMAHVAVDRARMRSGKSAPVDAGLFPWRRDLHGEIFCRAFEALIRRTEVDFGASSEIIVRLRLELNRYRLAQVQDLDEIADGWFWSGW